MNRYMRTVGLLAATTTLVAATVAGCGSSDVQDPLTADELTELQDELDAIHAEEMAEIEAESPDTPDDTAGWERGDAEDPPMMLKGDETFPAAPLERCELVFDAEVCPAMRDGEYSASFDQMFGSGWDERVAQDLNPLYVPATTAGDWDWETLLDLE